MVNEATAAETLRTNLDGQDESWLMPHLQPEGWEGGAAFC